MPRAVAILMEIPHDPRSIDMTDGQKVESGKGEDLDGLQVRVLKYGVAIYTKHSGSSEIDDMVSIISLPFCLDQVGIPSTNSENQVDDGEPLFWWSLHLTRNILLELGSQVDLADDRKTWVNAVHVGVEQELGDLWCRLLVGIHSVKGGEGDVVQVVTHVGD
jgi:hypothetical protein